VAEHRPTFEQREGLVPLPQQLSLGELNQAAKAALWYVINGFIEANKVVNDFGTDFADDHLRSIAERHFVIVEHGYIDDFSDRVDDITSAWRRYFRPDATYGETLGFVEWIVRADRGKTSLPTSIEAALIQTHCAYRLVNRDTIMPIASEEHAATVESALAALQTRGQLGAHQHLLAAASHLSQGRFADSVRESVHSIESLVRKATGQSKFSRAIAQLASERHLHESFKQALGNLYGYSSDEQGIRHPLLDKGDSNVTEHDALFMIGICSSFATYLGATA